MMWRHAEISALADIPRYWAACTPEQAALRQDDRSVSYAELDDRSDRIAAAITAAGITPGGHIGLLDRNSIEFFELWFGAAKAGCALAPFNWRCAEAELIELVTDAQTPILIVGPDFADLARRVRDATPIDMEVVTVGQDGELPSLDTWLHRHTGSVPAVRLHPEDIALLAYTSGTTGRPKGAQLSHRAFANWFLISSLERTETWNTGEVLLMVMPSFHLAGSWVSLPALYHGGTIVVQPTFEPEAFLAAVDRYRPTITCLVPTAIQILLDHPSAAGKDFSSLRRVLYAGSPIGPDTLRRAISTFVCELTQFYGTSETYIITLLRPQEHDPDRPDMLASCGQTVPLVDARTVDDEGIDVPPGEVGEVLVRSPMMFSGYWNRDEDTAAALIDGWYHTGDLGRRDEAGYLYLVDRLKDMIVTGGENVYSVEVERALARHPEVAACAVVGVPDERWGERIVAHVVTHADSEVNSTDLVAFCRSQIAGYKVPKQIHLADALPTTPSGKIRKDVLRREHNPDRLARL
jgi:acyl-CoA synthetase (AMP-forming)/AMP-acid ligase II